MGMSIVGGVGSLTTSVNIVGPIGQKVMASSVSVVIASNQSNVPENVAQWGGTNTTLGQKLMAASVPMVLASDQSDVPMNIDEVGGVVVTLGQKVMASSFPVVLPSNQSAIPTQSPVNTNGSILNQALTTTTASLATAPGNAVGFILQAESSNDQNIRYRVGGTASTSAGQRLEPGRDTGFVPCDANVSVCAEVSGTNSFSIQWILSV